ncbi:MAG: ATP-binding cassette domain-containing protein, partial [Planctomycetes bacterium]|nr:ATP-binding cassette domain-containing protein [Planctomycetota bacterium]
MSDATGVAPPTRLDLLDARNIWKTYQLGRVQVPVLKGASLEVREGEWVAVLGSSGSGKSTLLHLMGDLDQADRVSGVDDNETRAGEITFRGRPLRDFSRRGRNRYRNRSIGFVFQFYHLLPELNVLENTMLPALVGLWRWQYWAR